jgi:hypothetical protein
VSRFTLLELDGVGIAVAGSARSVSLVLDDARRHSEDVAWLRSAAGSLVGVDPSVGWVASEVDHAES